MSTNAASEDPHVTADHGPPAPGKVPGPIRAARVQAFRAGRLFHRTHVTVCDLALAPQRPESAQCVRNVLPELVAAAGGMADRHAGEMERVIRKWFQDTLDTLTGEDHAEKLAENQRHLRGLSLSAQADVNLPRLQAQLLQPTLDELQDFRTVLCRHLPRAVSDAFQLGVAVEHGIFPQGPSDTEETSSPGPQSCSPRRGFGGTRNDNDDRLRLSPPPLTRDRPWASWWPAQVKHWWSACHLPDPPALRFCPDDPDERLRVIEELSSRALQLLGQSFPSPVALCDRFWLQDESAQLFRLDGRCYPVEDRRAFLVLKFLLNAHDHQATSKELRKLPACETDISKVIRKLPDELRDIVQASPGQSSLYYIRLAPLPEHGVERPADGDHTSNSDGSPITASHG